MPPFNFRNVFGGKGKDDGNKTSNGPASTTTNGALAPSSGRTPAASGPTRASGPGATSVSGTSTVFRVTIPDGIEPGIQQTHAAELDVASLNDSETQITENSNFSMEASPPSQQQRRATVNNLDKPRMKVFMESASRKIKRGLLLQKSVKKQAEDLERQSRRASLERSRASFQQQVGEGSEEKSSEDMTGSSTSRVARVLTDEQDNVPSVASVRSSLNNNQALSTINARPEQPRQESQPNPESAQETNADISVRDSGSTLTDI